MLLLLKRPTDAEFEVHTFPAPVRDKTKVKLKPGRGTSGMMSQAMLAQGRAIMVDLSGSSLAAYAFSHLGQKGVLGDRP